MKKRFNNKTQQIFGLSFGIIFSIILIVFILVVGIIVIRYFLDFQECGQLKIFIDDFKQEVDRAWKSDELAFDFEGRLPCDYICFFNSSESIRGSYNEIGFEISVYDDENMFFYPLDNCVDAYKVGHLNIDEITRFNNPYCIPVVIGKVKLRIEKGMNKGLVEVR